MYFYIYSVKNIYKNVLTLFDFLKFIFIFDFFFAIYQIKTSTSALRSSEKRGGGLFLTGVLSVASSFLFLCFSEMAATFSTFWPVASSSSSPFSAATWCALDQGWGRCPTTTEPISWPLASRSSRFCWYCEWGKMGEN